MKRIKTLTLKLIIFILLSSSTYAQTEIKLDWLVSAKSDFIGGNLSLLDMVTMADGSIVAVGGFQNTVDFDPGPDTFNLKALSSFDMYLVKYSNSGKLEYAYRFSASSNSVIIDDQENIYIAGSFRDEVDFNPGPGTLILHAETSSEIFISSFTSDGSFRFAVNIADTKGENKNQTVSCVAVDANQNIYVTGSFGGKDIDFDPGPGSVLFSSGDGYDIFFAKYDKNGNYLFAKAIQGNDDDRTSDIILDKENNIIIGGSFYSGLADFDPGSDTAYLSSKGRDDIFFAKYDSLGNYIFAKSIGGNKYDKERSIAVMHDNSIIICGSFGSYNVDFDPGAGTKLLSPEKYDDIFFAKYDKNGNYIFAYNIGGQGDDAGNRVATDNNNNIYITGTFASSTVDFAPGPSVAELSNIRDYADVFFAKYSENGDLIYAKNIGNKNNVSSTSLLVGNNGRIAIGGIFLGTLDVDPGAGVSNIKAISGAFFIAKYDNAGVYINNISADTYANYYGASTNITASAVDSSGNTYIAGTLEGRFDFDPGPSVFWLESSDDYRFCMYFAKYDRNGKFIFAKAIRGSEPQPFSMAVDKDQGIYFTGYATNSTDFDPSENIKYMNNSDTISRELIYGYFFAKYSKEGDLVFAYGGGESNYNHFYGITVDKKKNIYLAGGFDGKINFNPGGSPYILESKGPQHLFVAKYDTSGHLIFLNDIGAEKSGGGWVTDVKLNSKNEIIVAGKFNGILDFDTGPGEFLLNGGSGVSAGFLAGYKNNGVFNFALPIGSHEGYSDIQALKLIVDHSDKMLVSGSFNGIIDFDPGAAVATLTDNKGLFFASYIKPGQLRFVKGILRHTPSFSEVDGTEALAVDKDNNIYVGGQFGSLDIDCDPGPGSAILVNENYIPNNYVDINRDVFMAKYDSLGNYLFSYDFDGDSASGGNASKTINIDQNGNIIFSGYGETKIDFDPGPDSVFLNPTSLNTNLFIVKYKQYASCIIPDSLYTNQVETNAAKLHWAYNAYSKGFELAYKPTNEQTWLTINTGGSERSKKIKDLLPSTNYTWRIRSNCGTDSSTFSDSVFFTTKTVNAFDKNINPNSLKENVKNEGLKLYPNPVINELSLQLRNIKEISGKSNIEIYTTQGKLAISTTAKIFEHTINTTIKILNTISKGIYFIVIRTKDNTYSTYFIKQ